MGLRWWWSAVLIATAGSASAEVQVEGRPGIERYETVHEAAAAALHAARRQSLAWEVAGLIFLDSQGFGFTEPHTSESTDSFDIVAFIPESASIAGIFHTHPPGFGDGKRFSGPDMETARFFGVPSFILDIESGEMAWMPVERSASYRTSRSRADEGVAGLSLPSLPMNQATR